MKKIALIEKVFEENGGIFRLHPVFVPRRFGKAGKRLKLHPDDYYPLGIERGSIKERWFASTITANNGPLAAADEGLSYVNVSYNTDEQFSLKDAVEHLGGRLVGDDLMELYGGWPMYSKFFDFENPLFHHLHLTSSDASHVGKLGKPESYYFPYQLNNHAGEFSATYFGYAPGVTKAEVRERLLRYNEEDIRITELSRAYRAQLGTGWYTPPGVVHAPASYLTYEPQWNSDVNSVHENIVSSEIYPRDMLVEELPSNEKDSIESIMNLMDWEKNTDPYYREKYFRPPVVDKKTDNYVEKWVSYANDYFGAKELTIFPGKTVTLVDEVAYGIIFLQGHGKFGSYEAETPTLLRFGQQSSDEFFVSAEASGKGVIVTNTSPTEPLVALKHFGPNHPNMPKEVPKKG